MPTLEIILLGHPQLILDSVPFKIRSPRSVALMAYLAITQRPCARADLIRLLWPVGTEAQNAATLRTMLWRLRDTPLAKWLEINEEFVALKNSHQVRVDVSDFLHLIESTNTCNHPLSTACPNCVDTLTQAIHLYQSDFMQGHHLEEADRFTYWQTGQRDTLIEKITAVYQRLLNYHSQQGQFKQAIGYAKRWLTYDPADENTHRLLMRLYANTGQIDEALKQYQRCKLAIARVYDATPAMETSLLYNQIQSESTKEAAATPLAQPALVLVSLHNAVELWANDPTNLHLKAERLLKIAKRCARYHAGQIIKYDRDHVILLFTKGQPLHFALDIHRQMVAEPWGDSFTPVLCTSILSGLPGQSTIDAGSLQTLYALAKAAVPGQVLANAEAATTLPQPRRAQMQDHGVHLLKDLAQPIHVVELLHPDLSDNQGKPIRSVTRREHNLPVPPTRFVGREQEREKIRHMLSQPDCRLLTLVGPGGVGKTRLATQVADEVKHEYADGVFYITLVAAKQAHHIPSMLADTMGLRYNAQQDGVLQVINYLRTKQVLLVLDNLEHLVKGSEILADLLSQASGVKILATSRERLNLLVELVYEVEGLPCPLPPYQPGECEHIPAMQLFIQSARRSLAGFQPKGETLHSIGKICRLVNGMPLAIELAAAWVRTLPCAEIAANIEQNLDFLVSPLRDLPQRHSSLRAVFEHSWDLLSEEERRVLARLSVFCGGFTALAAERVTDASPLVLTALADKSILQHDATDRYELLDVLRHYAADKLRDYPGEPKATRERHGATYAAQMFQAIFDINTHQQRQTLEWFQVEFENIRAAWNWALQQTRWEALDQMQAVMYQSHDIVGRFAEAWAIFASAIQALQSKVFNEYHQGVLAKLQMWKGWFAFRLGDQEIGLKEVEQALDIFRQTGLTWERTYTLNYLADAYTMLRRYDLARARLEESLNAFPCPDQPATPQEMLQAGYTQYLEGVILHQQGYPARARPYLEKSLKTMQNLGSRWAIMRVLAALARAWEALQNHEEALKIRLQVLQICEELGDRRGIAASLNNLSVTYESLGKHEQATQMLNQALLISREIGDRRLTAVILLNLANDYRNIYHTPAEAIPIAQEALQIMQEIGDESGTVYAGYDLAGAYLDAGQTTQAYGTYCKVLLNASETQSLSLQLHAMHGMALYYAQTNHIEQAIQLCTMILAHPASEADTRERAARLLSNIEDRLPAEESMAARQAGRLLTLDQALIQALLAGSRSKEGALPDDENAFGP